VSAARVLVILACASFCWAQSAAPSPASPPNILLLVRQQFKPERTYARDRLERAISAAYNRLEVPVYWMEMQSFSGTPEALLFDLFDSFEAVEKAGAVLAPLYEAQPDLVRWQAGIDDALSSQRTILAVRRDSPGAQADLSINLAQARFMRMLVIRTAPGQEPPVLDNASLPAITYQVNSGMPGPGFLIFLPMAALSDIPSIRITTGTIVEDSVYAIEPEMSHVSRPFAQQDQSFWTKP